MTIGVFDVDLSKRNRLTKLVFALKSAGSRPGALHNYYRTECLNRVSPQHIREHTYHVNGPLSGDGGWSYIYSRADDMTYALSFAAVEIAKHRFLFYHGFLCRFTSSAYQSQCQSSAMSELNTVFQCFPSPPQQNVLFVPGHWKCTVHTVWGTMENYFFLFFSEDWAINTHAACLAQRIDIIDVSPTTFLNWP